MLTYRGWWLFLINLSLVVVAVSLGLGTMTLACLALMAWFLGGWLSFHVRLRCTAPGLRVERSLERQGSPVDVLWAHSTATMVVRLQNASRVLLPYVAAFDRVPALAQLKDGSAWGAGELSRDHPVVIRYEITCPAAGRMRCDGLKVQVADLHGLFTANLFVRDVRSYRVLPAVTDEPEHLPTLKRHNLLPLLGTHRHLRPGSGSELLDLRDYLPGDPPKMIAWKASARRDRLMTKEFESEVPVRCTLFVDVSSSVRVGPPGGNALTRVVAIASALVHANAEQRDLTGLCLVDDEAVRALIKPERGRRHVYRLVQRLADAAELAPVTELAPLARIVPLAYGLAQDVYPELLARDVNAFPWWLPLWSPQPIYTVPRPGRAPKTWPAWLWYSFRRWLRESPIGMHRGRLFRLSPWRYRMYRLRKKVAAILAVRYRLGPAGLAWLLEDDVACSQYVQQFLAEHQVAAPLPLYDEEGRYRFASPQKIERLARALLGAVLRGKENELFVLLVDLLDGTHLEPLLRAVRVALARHHQVQVICPWPPGVPVPSKASAGKVMPPPLPRPRTGPGALHESLARAGTHRLHQAYARVQDAFAQLGVGVIAAPEGQAVSLVLGRLHKLPWLAKEHPMNDALPSDAPRNDTPHPPIRVGTIHYQILCGAGLLLMFLAQLEQGIVQGNLLLACVGLLGIVSKTRAAALLLLVVFAGVQIGHHLMLYRTFDEQDRRPLLHLRDLLLAIGLVAYVSANCRLQSLWAHILPPDARQREARSEMYGRWLRREVSPVQMKRDTRLMTPLEIARFVLALPLWALLGQAAWIVIAQPWSLAAFPNHLIHRLLALLWLLIVGALVVGTILAYWRRRQMDPTAAALYLQDTLWKETRREQRRSFRWLAWRKLHERAEQ